MDGRRSAQHELEDGIRRLQEALSKVGAAQLRAAAEGISRAGERAARRQERKTERHERRAAEKLERARRHLERSRREDRQASRPHAFVFGAASAVMLAVAATQPHLWWLLFVSFGFGVTAADQLAKVRRREREETARDRDELERFEREPLPSAVAAPAAPAPPAEPESREIAAIGVRLARVDAICDRLLAELKGAPPVVRELLRKPEDTVEALRAASRELGRRERELRGAITEEDGERLRAERAELEARIAAAPDAVVRARLTAALEALDAQLANRADLATSAARIEAEGTRILYSLEGLRAQILRTWAADSAAADVTAEGLRGSLEKLSAEVDAVATALEEVHGVGVPSAGASPALVSRRLGQTT